MILSIILLLSVISCTVSSLATLTIARTRLVLGTSFAIRGDTFFVAQLDTSPNPQDSKLRAFTTDEFKDHAISQASGLPPLISPIAVRIDSCDRLWVLDNGVTNIAGKQIKTASAALYALHLSNKTISTSATIPQNLLNKDSFLVSLAVDVDRNCLDTAVFIADLNRPALLVYNASTHQFRLLKHHFFNPHPLSKVPSGMIFNKEYSDISGIYGMSIVDSQLYFHAMASPTEFVVPTSVLRSRENLQYNDITVAYNRPVEAGAEVEDESTSVRFFSEYKSIGCMGVNNHYTSLDTGLYMGLIWDIAVNGSDLWLLVNEDDSYKVYHKNIQEIISGTACAEDVNSTSVINRSKFDLPLQTSDYDYVSGSSDTPIYLAIVCLLNVILVYVQ